MTDARGSRAERRLRRDAYMVEYATVTRTLKSGDMEEILRLLDSEWPRTRARVVRELRRRGWTGRALPQLIEQAAREQDDSVKNSIALALRDLEDHQASETLWALFENGSDGVQMAALQALSRLRDERVVPIALSWYRNRDAGSKPKRSAQSPCSIFSSSGRAAATKRSQTCSPPRRAGGDAARFAGRCVGQSGGSLVIAEHGLD